MRLAIISDIHANREALDSVLAALAEERVDKIICVGDLVDFGPSPKEVLQLIQKAEITAVKGNHDLAVLNYDSTQFHYKSLAEQRYVEDSLAATRRLLSPSDKDFLAALPVQYELELDGSRIVFLHSLPDLYAYPLTEQIEAFLASGSWHYVFWGHTHRPSLYTYQNKMAVNVGSVGKPKHGNPMAAFCLADFDTGQLKALQFRYVSYEVEKVCSKIVERGFPVTTIDIIRTGSY